MSRYSDAKQAAEDAKTARDQIKSRGQRVPDKILQRRGETETNRRDLGIAAQHKQGIKGNKIKDK